MVNKIVICGSNSWIGTPFWSWSSTINSLYVPLVILLYVNSGGVIKICWPKLVLGIPKEYKDFEFVLYGLVIKLQVIITDDIGWIWGVTLLVIEYVEPYGNVGG